MDMLALDPRQSSALKKAITYLTPLTYILHLSKHSFIMKVLDLHLREQVVEIVAGQKARVRKDLIINFKDL